MASLAKISSWSLVLLAAGAASAEPFEARFYNTHSAPVTQVQLSDAEDPERVWSATVNCEAQAICSFPLDLPIGRFSATLRVAETPIGPWSDDSQVVELRVPTDRQCMDNLSCRADFDGDKHVGGTDFQRFLGAFGTGW